MLCRYYINIKSVSRFSTSVYVFSKSNPPGNKSLVKVKVFLLSIAFLLFYRTILNDCVESILPNQFLFFFAFDNVEEGTNVIIKSHEWWEISVSFLAHDSEWTQRIEWQDSSPVCLVICEDVVTAPAPRATMPTFDSFRQQGVLRQGRRNGIENKSWFCSFRRAEEVKWYFHFLRLNLLKFIIHFHSMVNF